jgi:hypothetical protein
MAQQDQIDLFKHTVGTGQTSETIRGDQGHGTNASLHWYRLVPVYQSTTRNKAQPAKIQARQQGSASNWSKTLASLVPIDTSVPKAKSPQTSSKLAKPQTRQ